MSRSTAWALFQGGHWPTSLPSLSECFFMRGLITPILQEEEFDSYFKGILDAVGDSYF